MTVLFTDFYRCCFESFMTVLRGSSRWIYPICRALAVVLRIMATRVDINFLKAGDAKAAVCRSNAAGLFRQCIADHLRDPEGSVLTSRSYLTLLMVNQCMRLFMQLATYKHCRSITLPAQPPLSAYPMSERVTYEHLHIPYSETNARQVLKPTHLCPQLCLLHGTSGPS
jgi:hypothetical protein